MTDLLEDIESFIIEKGHAEKGTVFRDASVNKPDNIVVLYEYQGSSPLPQIASFVRPVQIVVRDMSATKAKEKAREIFNSMQTDTGILYLTEDRWTVTHLQQPPFKLKVDDNKRVHYCFNAVFTTYED